MCKPAENFVVYTLLQVSHIKPFLPKFSVDRSLMPKCAVDRSLSSYEFLTSLFAALKGPVRVPKILFLTSSNKIKLLSLPSPIGSNINYGLLASSDS